MSKKSLPDLSGLTRKELAYLANEISRKLAGYEHPPNDWHNLFYSSFNIDLHKYLKGYSIERENILGIQPPRADIVLRLDKIPGNPGLDVFKFFRKYNIIEFKSPDDSLNEATLWKTIGYAAFYISDPMHKGTISPDDVTISIFRSTKPIKLFRTLSRYIVTDPAIKGIYRIAGWKVDFPIQIVVTAELEGPEYAGFRAISKKPDLDDILQIVKNQKKETKPDILEYYHSYFEMLNKIDSPAMKEFKRRNPDMSKSILDLFREEIDEEIRNNLFSYVQDGAMLLDYAAKRANMTPELFADEMRKAGYTVPDIAPV